MSTRCRYAGCRYYHQKKTLNQHLKLLHLQQCSELGYLARRLSRKRIHNFLHPIVREDGTIVEKMGVWDVISINDEVVGHHGVPVVKLDELLSDAVTVLELLFEEQGGIELQLEQITTYMLHILLNYDLHCFS